MTSHTPVLLTEVMLALVPEPGKIILDATFGGGGYSRAFLERGATVYALDRDTAAQDRARELANDYPQNFKFYAGCFSDLIHLAQQHSWPALNGIVFDYGVSSFQLETAERGFSFRLQGPLDMRMSENGQSAADVVNTFEESDIADIIYRYGEERFSRRIAKKIILHRQEVGPITTTQTLAQLVAQVVYAKPGAIHPATRTFQALRIFVNNELTEIEAGLEFSLHALAASGILACVSFHSLEDRVVKTFIRTHTSRMKRISRLLPGEIAPPQAQLIDKTPRGITPGEDEQRLNPRSRSARLRVAERMVGAKS